MQLNNISLRTRNNFEILLKQIKLTFDEKNPQDTFQQVRFRIYILFFLPKTDNISVCTIYYTLTLIKKTNL